MHFQSLFYPTSIAVIGASRSVGSVGNDLIKNLVLQGYSGKIYPVNPNGGELYGLPVYTSVSEVPGTVELALVAVPAQYVPAVIEAAADKGAKAAIVISAGFKEVGNTELESQLSQLCNKREIALIGPNCLGVINPELKMNASFASLMPDQGQIAFISQSGALCSSVLDYAKEFNLGFSKFLSIGNKACIDEITLLKYFADDPQTKVIAMYVEQLENAPEFIKVAHDVISGENPKPIIILKSGRTAAGAAAIASHTGSLAGGDAAYEALFAQSGIIRPNTIRELFEFIDIFSHNPLTPVEKVAIITNAGGPGVIATDEVIRQGLELAPLTENTKMQLKSFLPSAASVKNPVDILGDAKADRYQRTLEVLEADETTDAMMVLLTPQSTTQIEETAKALVQFRANSKKPVVVSFMGKETVDYAIRLMERGKVSTTAFPELAARGLARLRCFMRQTKRTYAYDFTFDHINQTHAAKLIKEVTSAKEHHVPESKALPILESYSFPTLKRMVLTDEVLVTQASDYFTSPVALKIISPDIVHKSDVGGVKLNVSPKDIATEYQQLLATVSKNKPEATLEGVLAVEMAPSDGLELIVGVNKLPGLGTLLMIGLGGVYVEVFQDVSFGYAPLSRDYAAFMIERLNSYPILKGVRGHQGYDIESLVEVLGRLSLLVTNHPEITELDINPLLVLPKGRGCRVLDARIMLE